MTEQVELRSIDTWLRNFASLVAKNRDYLTTLDAAIGDADHGSNMDRGLTAAVEAVDATAPATSGALLTKVGMTLVSTMGGASGPLFGTLFFRMGSSLGETGPTSPELLGRALQAGVEGIVSRGRPLAGDKTMFDALAPAATAFEEAVAQGATVASAMQRARDAAATGRDATSQMQARKGRASYLGVRSVGHIDPGAASVALLFDAAAGAF